MKRYKTILFTLVLITIGSVTFAVIGKARESKPNQALSRDTFDLATQEPFQKNVTATLGAGDAALNVSIDVPTGKLFVIEQVSISGSAPSDQRIDLSLSSHISPDLSFRPHYLTAERQIVSGQAYYKATHQVKIYGDTPNVYVRVSRSTSPDTVTFRFTVSGYFIDK